MSKAEKAENKMIKVVLPSDPTIKGANGQEIEQTEFFSVNGVNYLIKCDEEVEVPPEVYEVIKNKAEARAAAREFRKAKAFKPPKA